MSLFFEDEIRKVMGKAGTSGMNEIISQDPRRNGRLASNHTHQLEGESKSKEQSPRRRPRWI
ncbi:hypothetical protein QTL97_06960 [Sporosarcina thermotolerans]|uniref:Uncharacterized protein n=1 Tax=Sporosarcina thermotolerans TaxID=633404 RepID=A0AAW9A8L0_9BACL|nr:hypothetical protein [Sporosarcina thermotolerans]MDW0116670.1 hypothetical protein [Sporosarcina thermotolerans]WHT48867.1 hypothetical protein QNH10_03885 [Sporosarcina thermotolerans]